VGALCQIAGWLSMRMVTRYAVFEQSDLDDIMQKTAGLENVGEHSSGTVPELCPS